MTLGYYVWSDGTISDQPLSHMSDDYSVFWPDQHVRRFSVKHWVEQRFGPIDKQPQARSVYDELISYTHL